MRLSMTPLQIYGLPAILQALDTEDAMSVERARAELALVESELGRLKIRLNEAEARIVKLQNYIDISSEYERFPDGLAAAKRTAVTIQEVMSHEAKTELLNHGARLSTAELLRRLESRGVEVPGNNKIQNLSGYLSRSGMFDANRKEGWGLKEWKMGDDSEDERASADPPQTQLSEHPNADDSRAHQRTDDDENVIDKHASERASAPFDPFAFHGNQSH